ncbi:hypothetical protein PG985_009405 [Apiospora marii]|uniref:Cyanovirin-N domain-containing protein n=1 Tax=Apiospora marii TaxID=335849 RepID=A0ABR1RF66_9PEZI
MPLLNRLSLLLLLVFSVLVSAESYLKYCSNYDIVTSQKVRNKVFLKADCLGIYGNVTATQCTYLDLNQCYALDTTKKQYKNQRLGKGFYKDTKPDRVSWCHFTYADANYKNANKPTGIECSARDELAGTYTAQFRNLIGAELGFLHCWKRPGFGCPENGEEFY